MATYTAYLNLKKPIGDEDFDILNDFNANWDKLDGFVGECRNTVQSGVSSISGLSTLLDSLLTAMPTNGVKAFQFGFSNIESPFTQATYFGTLYKSGTGTTYSSAVFRRCDQHAIISGVRNTNGWSFQKLARSDEVFVEFGESSKSIDQNLADYWATYIPNDGQPHLVKVNALYGICVGFLTRYSNSYGSGCLTRYEGTIYRVCLDNGSVSNQPLALRSQLVADWTGCANYKESIESSATVLLQSFGKLRILTFQGVARAHTEDELLMTLPTEHRPWGGAIFAPGTVGGTAVEVRISTDGKVTLFLANGAGNARLYFQACWIVA